MRKSCKGNPLASYVEDFTQQQFAQMEARTGDLIEEVSGEEAADAILQKDAGKSAPRRRASCMCEFRGHVARDSGKLSPSIPS